MNDIAKILKINNYKFRFKDYNIFSLSQVYLFENQNNKESSLISFIKKYSLDNILKSLASFFTITNKKTSHISVLFVNDIYNFSMISNSRIIQKEFDKKIFHEVISDKRIKDDQSVLIFQKSVFLKSAIDFISLIFSYNQIKNELKEISKIFSVNIFKILLNIFDSIFIINTVEAFFDKYKNINSVVLNTDAHKISRAIVFYCKKKNINTYVLQHGEPVAHFGYLPVYSDKLFTWGLYSYNWFVQNNTNNDHLIITGTPKVDDLYSIVGNQDKLIIDNLSILVILNPIGESLCEDFLKIIKEACLRTNKNYKLSIKLHPSSKSYQHLPAKILQNIDYKIYYLDDLHTLIKNNDLVISTPSTAGSEVVACQKPLLTMYFEELTYTLAYESYDCNIKFHDLTSLIFYLDDIDNLQSNLIFYDKFIKDYFYKLDGKSSKRIFNYIQSNK